MLQALKILCNPVMQFWSTLHAISVISLLPAERRISSASTVLPIAEPGSGFISSSVAVPKNSETAASTREVATEYCLSSCSCNEDFDKE